MNSQQHTPLNAGQTLAELATRVPAASRAFREVGLDYCCGGQRTLAAACAEKGLDAAALIRSFGAEAPAEEPSWEERPVDALIQHILDRYHAPLRQEIRELHMMAKTVEEKHREKSSCPRGLSAHLAAVYEAVLAHLEKEEMILFPMILAGHGSRADGPIRMMELEHDEHGASLARIRSLTNDLQAPAEACPTWQALYLRLRELEADLMDHIHLENHVLFPRVLCA